MILKGPNAKQKIIEALNNDELFPEGTTIEQLPDGDYVGLENFLLYYLDEDEIEDVIRAANLPYSLDEIVGRE